MPGIEAGHFAFLSLTFLAPGINGRFPGKSTILIFRTFQANDIFFLPATGRSCMPAFSITKTNTFYAIN